MGKDVFHLRITDSTGSQSDRGAKLNDLIDTLTAHGYEVEQMPSLKSIRERSPHVLIAVGVFEPGQPHPGPSSDEGQFDHERYQESLIKPGHFGSASRIGRNAPTLGGSVPKRAGVTQETWDAFEPAVRAHIHGILAADSKT